jgi:hypothetical protein
MRVVSSTCDGIIRLLPSLRGKDRQSWITAIENGRARSRQPMNPRKREKNWDFARASERIHSLHDISLNYEGQTEEIAVRPPDVSRSGMFISTSRKFPEGAVLNLRFRLALTQAEIRTRCEVRYCMTGVGVGVEFVGISPESVSEIEREIKLCEHEKPRRKKSRAKPRKR